MGGLLANLPPPLSDAIARPERWSKFPKGGDPLAGLLTQPWIDFFTSLINSVQAAPAQIANVQLTNQTASIGATDFSGADRAAGLYRWSYIIRVTSPATISSSLQVTIDWEDDGQPQSFTGAALTGNLSTTYESESQLIKIDSLSPIRYSVVYAQAGIGLMEYSLYITLEEVLA